MSENTNTTPMSNNTNASGSVPTPRANGTIVPFVVTDVNDSPLNTVRANTNMRPPLSQEKDILIHPISKRERTYSIIATTMRNPKMVKSIVVSLY